MCFQGNLYTVTLLSQLLPSELLPSTGLKVIYVKDKLLWLRIDKVLEVFFGVFLSCSHTLQNSCKNNFIMKLDSYHQIPNHLLCSSTACGLLHYVSSHANIHCSLPKGTSTQWYPHSSFLVSAFFLETIYPDSLSSFMLRTFSFIVRLPQLSFWGVIWQNLHCIAWNPMTIDLSLDKFQIKHSRFLVIGVITWLIFKI